VPQKKYGGTEFCTYHSEKNISSNNKDKRDKRDKRDMVTSLGDKLHPSLIIYTIINSPNTGFLCEKVNL
jgi:hypothetical protein